MREVQLIAINISMQIGLQNIQVYSVFPVNRNADFIRFETGVVAVSLNAA